MEELEVHFYIELELDVRLPCTVCTYIFHFYIELELEVHFYIEPTLEVHFYIELELEIHFYIELELEVHFCIELDLDVLLPCTVCTYSSSSIKKWTSGSSSI